MSAAFETVILRTPPLPRLVPDRVFDAFGWCESRTLEWRRPPGRVARGEPIDGRNPPRMAFVFRGGGARDAGSPHLPRELASLHVPSMALPDEWILAPYAIDAATDVLYETRTPPEGALLLAADRLTALVWGLHDWSHFHNHGPFEARAETELQCDAAALVWLLVNRDRIDAGEHPLGGRLDDATWEDVRREVCAVAAARFAEAGAAFDPARLSAGRLRGIAGTL